MPDMNSIINQAVKPHFSLFKGEPGVRKSTQALSYPKPQYWFSFDQKMGSLELPMKLWKVNPADITFDDYSDWTKAKIKLEAFQTECKYKTIVIDSITSLADYVLRQTVKLKKGSTRQSGAEAGKRIAGIDVNEVEDYNAEAAALTELIALLKDIHRFHKIDIVLIAHVIRTESKDLSGKVNVSRTLVTAAKKPAAKIPAYCDEVYHFGVDSDIDVSKGGNYTILTSHVGEDYARTSLPLPTRIDLGDKPLYETYLIPAMKKLSDQPQQTSSF